jgi:hypothetical protein
MLNFHAMMLSGSQTSATSFIDSIEEIEITLAGGSTTGTATITSVDTSRTVILFNGWRSNINSDLTQLLCYLQLTNSTTVTATRNTGTNAAIVRATVVQFKSTAVSSVQYGTISMGTSTSATATITSVNTARSIAFYLGNMANNTATSDRDLCDVTLTNATTVTASRGDAFTNTATVGFVVVEFQAAYVDSVQQVSITIAAGSTSNTASISSIDTSRSVLVFKGNTMTDAQNANTALARVSLTNATTVTATRNTSSASFPTSVKATVIQFASGVIHSIQRGTITIATSSASQVDSITAIDTAKTAIFYGGVTSTSTSIFDENSVFPTISLSSTTTITATRGNADAASSLTVAYQVVRFV